MLPWLGECPARPGNTVRGFNYHNALAFYEKSLKMWARLNKSFSYSDEAPLYMASSRRIRGGPRPADIILMVTGTAVHKTFYECMKKWVSDGGSADGIALL